MLNKLSHTTTAFFFRIIHPIRKITNNNTLSIKCRFGVVKNLLGDFRSPNHAGCSTPDSCKFD